MSCYRLKFRGPDKGYRENPMCADDVEKRLQDIAEGSSEQVEIPASKIQELKQLVAGLRPLKSIIQEEYQVTQKGVKRYRVKSDPDSPGTGWLHILHRSKRVSDAKNGDVSIGLGELEKGYRVGMHKHAEAEFFLIISGCVRIGDERAPDKPSTICRAQGYEVPAGVRHSFEALERTELLVVTFPASTEWPQGDDEIAWRDVGVEEREL
jgi:mannose-6-phosphate isomerase-like protein (cupin superfamily)